MMKTQLAEAAPAPAGDLHVIRCEYGQVELVRGTRVIADLTTQPVVSDTLATLIAERTALLDALKQTSGLNMNNENKTSDTPFPEHALPRLRCAVAKLRDTRRKGEQPMNTITISLNGAHYYEDADGDIRNQRGELVTLDAEDTIRSIVRRKLRYQVADEERARQYRADEFTQDFERGGL